VYWSNAVQIIPPHDHGIASKIQESLEIDEQAWEKDSASNKSEWDGTEEMIQKYIAMTGELSSRKEYALPSPPPSLISTVLTNYAQFQSECAVISTVHIYGHARRRTALRPPSNRIVRILGRQTSRCSGGTIESTGSRFQDCQISESRRERSLGPCSHCFAKGFKSSANRRI